MLDALPGIVYLKGSDYTIHFANQAFLQLFGDYPGKKCYEAVANLDEPCPGCPNLEVLQTGTPHQMEWTLPTISRSFQVYNYPFTNSDGSILVLGLAVDITERKQAENDLRESQRQMAFQADLLESSSQPFAGGRADGRIVFFNSAFNQMLGYSREEFQNLNWDQDLNTPEWREREREQLQEQQRTGLPVRYEKEYFRKDGSRMPVELLVHLRRAEQGESDLYYVFATDITERKQYEAEILRQQEKLRGLAARLSEVQEANRQELARELHDQVCQNLTSICIVIETLIMRTKGETKEQLLSRLADLGTIAEQTNEITRGIMEGLRPTVLDHYGLMGGLKQLGQQFSQQNNIAVEMNDKESAPRLSPPVELALYRITQEALGNVAKHSKATRVVLFHEQNQDTFRLTISDNGIGFDSSKTTPIIAGHQWGLTTMTERAIAVGGQCYIESQPGQGTQVAIEVPL